MARHLLLMAGIMLATAAYAITAEQTAGIYYAYPGPQGTLTPTPEGYVPFYISHYGRHGSRWITDDYRYYAVAHAFDSVANLTDLGLDVRARLDVVLEDAIGRSGALSPVGERQHRDIATRMAANFPEAFPDTARVHAASSTQVRCVVSMACFTEALKAKVHTVDISHSASARDMRYIAYTSPQGKEFSADTAAWQKQYYDYAVKNIDPRRLMASLFKDPSALSYEEQMRLAVGLYWIASDMQDTELDLSFYDIFTPDELEGYWRAINSRMYVCNGNYPLAGGVMKHCADNLLSDIVDCADKAIAGNGLSANLRFGHDTHLLRLLTLIGLEGCAVEETDWDKFHQAWPVHELSPMAANLQMIFYRNAEGDILVKFLLNEGERAIPALGAGPYYDWVTLRSYLTVL